MNHFFGERHYEKQAFSLVNGQSLYLLSFKCEVSIGGGFKIIEKQKFFHTQVQGLTDAGNMNLKADICICKQILTQLKNEFFKEYNDYIDEQIRKKIIPLGSNNK